MKKNVKLAGWVCPGIAPRFASEGAWNGPAHLGLLLMLAPIACLYLQLNNQRGTWLFVVPDVYDLDEFDLVMSGAKVFLDPAFADAASIGDAALRFLSAAELAARTVGKELRTGCRVVAMGKAGYYHPNQSIRKGIADVPRQTTSIRRYLRLQQAMGNRWTRRRLDDEDADEQPTARRKKLTDKSPKPTHFVSVPTGRGRIADNLVLANPWYADLIEPLPWDREPLERLRKRRPGTSIERLWFQNLCYQRGKLMELIQDNEMWDDPDERLFVEAFWEILGLLYIRERKAVERGGSRTYEQRCEDLNEEIRRILSRSKTGPLLREAVAELMTRPFKMYRADSEGVTPTRSKSVRRNPAAIWRMIDGDWKRGRDLALLALASYQSKEKRSSDEAESVGTPNRAS